ncbi:MAG TPA: DUF3142 domain-containing protein [Novosphingobium sp.]
MKRARALLPFAAALLLGSCGERAAQRVDPQDHQAFFLWAGVRPPAVLARAKTIYILSGEVRVDDPARLIPLRPQAPHVAHAEVWLTVRAERLDWDEGVYRQIGRELDRWRAAGSRVVGLQIDFDARTRGLDRYAAFLADLRRRLPRHYRLSITGLLDWSAGGDPAALASLHWLVDEVVIQTYQGRRTIPGYERYMASLTRLPLPYRVALVERGAWGAPSALARDPEFRGYVVFLLPDSDRSK